MKIKISRNLYIILTIDILLLCLSFYVAHLIRFDFMIPQWAMEKFFNMLPYVVAVKIFYFYFFDLYKGMWRYTGLNDLLNVVKASTLSGLSVIVLVLFVNRFENVSRSVFIIDWCLTLICIVALRVMTRLAFEQFTENINFQDLKEAILNIFKLKSRHSKGVIIIGAGDCGEKICREIREDASLKYHVDCFLDDDLSKIGRKIHGISVLDKIDALLHAVESTGAKEVIIALPSLKAERMRRIINICKKADIVFKIVPSMGELINGKLTLNSIREVEYKDLLGREPVQLKELEIGKYLGNKNILVTGAAGSIGTGLSRQICRYSPKRVILFERAESPLYELELELKKSFPNIEIVLVLGDIQDKEELYKTFDLLTPNIIFHAAAYKHVPMLEKYPWKAVENNIFGTKNLVEVADQFKCEKFVFVSTDKAVNPCNVMGASKRVAEMIVQNQSTIKNSKTGFITVRFGNVIGSVGSVIHLFKRQIQEGGPVTVTHPEIIRYFMLIPEACQLILQASAMGKGNEIFILEMGKPIKIDNMARDLIRFSGFEPDVEIKIEYTGLRPGEKLYEELMTGHENVVPTDHNKIMVLNSSKVDMEVLNSGLDQLKEESKKRSNDNIRKVFKKIVPEYNPNPTQE